MGGVAISGGRGTAKSVMARALHRIMPPIERVKDSDYNIDPEQQGEVDSFLRVELEKKDMRIEDLETEIIPCPFVQVPLNVMEDRLLGSVNVEQSVKLGKTVFEPGLLAKAHRGILYVDDINLLDSELANIMLGILSEGWVTVEREGVSVRYPCRPLLIATFNPEEAELRDHLLDRISVSLSADAQVLTLDQRLEAVTEVLDFGKMGSKMDADTKTAFDKIIDDEDQLRTRIVFAREALKDTQLSRDQKIYLAEEAARAGCQGHRGEIFACEIARSSAALNDRRVDQDDLRTAVRLAILPRSTYVNDPDENPEDMMPPPPPPPPPQQDQNTDQDEAEQDQQDNEDEEGEEEGDDKDQDTEQEPPEDDEQPSVPQEFMFDVEGAFVDPDLLDFAKKTKSGKGGGRGLVFSNDRGRYIKPMLPRGKVTRLAVDATMRAAAPYQKPRRLRNDAKGSNASDRKVFIENSDVRVKRMARKAGSLIIFVCDASGSMALNRMNQAKGATMSLLTEAYQSRDKICIIPFQGDFAEVLLPPTRSIAMARKRLETMPCGGGSPLAHALNVAVRTGLNAQKSGDIGKVVVILLSDGRANVPLSYASDEGPEDPEREKPDRAALKEEVLKTAGSLRSLNGFNLVVLDTENKFVSTGMAKEIASAAGGRYHYIPKAGEGAIANIANQALSDAKA
jgi:magnesium chelatase subunit D